MTLKSGKILRTIRITDGESSLTSKIFLDEDDKLDIREGMLLKLSGKLQLDTYAGNEKTLMINSVNILMLLFTDPSASNFTNTSPLAPTCGRFTKSVSSLSCLRE